jgi:hypothetical protein
MASAAMRPFGYRSEELCLASRKSFKEGLVISLIQRLLAVTPIVKALSLAGAAPTDIRDFSTAVYDAV